VQRKLAKAIQVCEMCIGSGIRFNELLDRRGRDNESKDAYP
jgi:hypothetical protein